MDAVEYLKIKKKMVKANEDPYSPGACRISCGECPFNANNNGENVGCMKFEMIHPEKAVETVREWAMKNPKRTRQTRFFEMFPNAKTENLIIRISPCDINKKWEEKECDNYNDCDKCREDYWLAEVEE